MKMLTSPVDCI